MFFKVKSAIKVLTISAVALTGLAQAEELKPFQPFEISVDKSFTSSSPFANNSNSFFNDRSIGAENNFDFLSNQSNGYHFSKNKGGVFGEELVMGMKFADWLTLRVNVIDEETSTVNLFAPNVALNNYGRSNDDLLGYQFGVSSVLNITDNWRFGIDLGMGRVGGQLVGLYQDEIETTRLGFGIRNSRFGATFQSDFMNGMSNNRMEQSTMDLQVDWHFTKDGTISFGARRNIRENTPTGNTLDELTGTVPYIKFKHNL